MLGKQAEFRTFWSEEDKEYVAVYSKYPSLSVLDINEEMALKELKKLINELYPM